MDENRKSTEESRNPDSPKHGRKALLVLLVAGSIAGGGVVGAVLVGRGQTAGAAPADDGLPGPSNRPWRLAPRRPFCR